MRRTTTLLAALLLVAATTAAVAKDYTVGAMKISETWSRKPPGGARVAAGFMTITNTGTAPDTLIGGSAVISDTTEVHEMRMIDGVMQMRALQSGLVIKPGETVTLRPGGFHLMFIGLKQPPAEGKPFKGTLVFEKAGTVEVEYTVEAIGAADKAEKGGMHHGKH